jgi:NADH dehydrogenase FAD-containing subunit
VDDGRSVFDAVVEYDNLIAGTGAQNARQMVPGCDGKGHHSAGRKTVRNINARIQASSPAN